MKSKSIALIGKLDKGLDYVRDNRWTIVDMKNNWKVVYSFELNTKEVKIVCL